MQSAEQFASEIFDEHVHWGMQEWDEPGVLDLIRARDEAIRADERARCATVHSTLTDDDLVEELVRRGVLRGEESLLDLKCRDRQPVTPLPSVVMCCSGEYVTQRRYVTEWEDQP